MQQYVQSNSFECILEQTNTEFHFHVISYVLAYVPMYINWRDCDKVFRMRNNKVLQDV